MITKEEKEKLEGEIKKLEKEASNSLLLEVEIRNLKGQVESKDQEIMWLQERTKV